MTSPESNPEQHNQTSLFTILEQDQTPDGVVSTILLDGEFITLNPMNNEVMGIIGRMLAEQRYGEQTEGEQ